MLAYIIRRCLYGILIVLGVNILVFALFFLVNTPDRIARQMLGGKNVTQESIERWKRDHSYHYPLFFNAGYDKLTEADNRANVPVYLQSKSRDGREIQVPLHGPYVLRENVREGDYYVKLRHVRGSGTGNVVVSAFALPTQPNVTVSAPTPIAAESALTLGESRIVPVSSLVVGDVWVKLPIKATTSLVVSAASQSPTNPDDPAHTNAVVAIELYKFEDLPLIERFTKTIFWQRGVQLLWFDFGKADNTNIPISYEIRKRMFPSLQITVPIFILALIVDVIAAMFIAFYRGTYIDVGGTVACVIGMSISMLLYIIAGQLVFGIWLKWFPVSGFDVMAKYTIFGVEFTMARFEFLLMPVLIGVIAGAGSAIRFYRTIFLEEIGRDYIRTARAKGLSESIVLFKHGLKNAMIPILTSVVMTLPFLFMGNLLLEYFFAIPGLGSFLIEAIQNRDFATVRAMVYLGSVLYVVALILTDISYTLVDPRIRFS